MSTSSLVDQISRDLRDSLGWTITQPNGEALWRAACRQAVDLLDGLWRKGTLVGETASEAFYVRCGPTTMTQDDVDRGRLVLLVGVATARPAEFHPIQIVRLVGQPLRRSRGEE